MENLQKKQKPKKPKRCLWLWYINNLSNGIFAFKVLVRTLQCIFIMSFILFRSFPFHFIGKIISITDFPIKTGRDFELELEAQESIVVR